jgi:hypothetical protein
MGKVKIRGPDRGMGELQNPGASLRIDGKIRNSGYAPSWSWGVACRNAACAETKSSAGGWGVQTLTASTPESAGAMPTSALAPTKHIAPKVASKPKASLYRLMGAGDEALASVSASLQF